MDWFDFAIRAGLPTAFLAFIGWFLVRHVWPFITKAWNDSQTERREDREKNLAALEKQTEMLERLMDVERKTRVEERDRFVGILDRQGDSLKQIAEAQVKIVQTQEQILQALPKPTKRTTPRNDK